MIIYHVHLAHQKAMIHIKSLFFNKVPAKMRTKPPVKHSFQRTQGSLYINCKHHPAIWKFVLLISLQGSSVKKWLLAHPAYEECLNEYLQDCLLFCLKFFGGRCDNWIEILKSKNCDKSYSEMNFGIFIVVLIFFLISGG